MFAKRMPKLADTENGVEKLRQALNQADATYACLNDGETYAPDKIRKKSICINDDIRNILGQL